MALFKKKVSYTEYVGNFTTALIQSSEKDVEVVNTDGLLTSEERQKVFDNLLPLSLVILLLELTDTAKKGKNPVIPKSHDEEEINRLVASHLTELIGQIYLQLGRSEKDYQILIDRMMPYLNTLEEASDEDYAKGADYLATSCLPNLVLGKQSYSQERDTLKHFQVFDIGKQICKNTQAAYHNYAKDFAIAA